jgi:hypothetical protein
MSAGTGQGYEVINLFDWTGGIRNNRQNPLWFPHNALLDGEDVDIVNSKLRTRGGVQQVGSGKFDGTEVVALEQARFPTNETSYLIAQVKSEGEPLGEVIWTQGAQAPENRQYHVAALNSGKIYYFTGIRGGVGYSKAVDIYHIDSNTWSSGAPGGGDRREAAGAEVSGKVYIWGGFNISGVLNTMDIYDIATNSWSSGSTGGSARHGLQAHAYGGKIYYWGGSVGGGSVENIMEIYDTSTDTWSSGASGGIARAYHTCALLDGKIYIWGGMVGGSVPGEALDIYDPASNTWSSGASGGDNMTYSSMVGYGGRLFIWAGRSYSRSSRVNDLWVYDISKNSWSFMGSVGDPRQGHTATVYNGKFYGFGGDGVDDLKEMVIISLPKGGSNKIYVSTTKLPSQDLAFTEAYRLGNGAGTISCATLNDRMIITEGCANRPLVFAGCMDPSAGDWATPKAVLATFDSGANYHDISYALCDKDPDTTADIGGMNGGSGWVDICVDMSGVSGIYVEVGNGNTSPAGLETLGWSGAWTAGRGWVDGTSNLERDGIISHDSEVFSAEHKVINNVPGYWFRLKPSGGTTAGASLRRVLFGAPMQELQVIGEGMPDIPLGFIYWDQSEGSAKDWTVEVSDNTWPSVARLNNDPLNTDGSGCYGWQSGALSTSWVPGSDRLYVGYLTRFNGVDLRPHNDYHNTVSWVSLAGEYWNGENWSDISITDETRDSSGTTLSRKGRISWDAPYDWKQCRPIGPQYSQGYWIRLRTDKDLSLRTWISEARVWPLPDRLKKHKFAITVRDRALLLNRPDAPDQADISRALEEYGFTGADSASIRIGGQDGIVAAVEAFNQGFVAKSEDWFLFNGYNPQTFSFERAEAANQTPVNNQVVVRAPLTEADQKNLMGLYYINRRGAWHFAGLKVYNLSADVSWFDPSANLPRIDLDYLHNACGVYWPERNWILWAVPMIVSGTRQSSNNRLIVYDLTLGAWLPPFSISLRSMTTAYHYSADAPAKLGRNGLYGGDYSGRIVRLFTPENDLDLGAALNGWIETGWLHFGSPEFRKLIRTMTLYGGTTGSSIDVSVLCDGNEDSPKKLSFSALSGLGEKVFAQEAKPENLSARFFKFRIEFNDVTELFGMQIGASMVREWGAM